MVAAGLGRTFQNIRLFQNMTALENVLVGMHSRLKANLFDALLSTPRNRREEMLVAGRAEELLVARRASRAWAISSPRTCPTATSAASRSPGRGQRPVLLLLDEPTAGMNPNETAEMTPSSAASARTSA